MSSSSLSSVPALATTHSSDSFDHPSDWPDDVVRKLIRLFVYTNLPITLILEVLGRENLEEFANETIYYTLSDDPGWLRAAKLPDMDRRMTNLRARIEYVKQFRLDDNNAVPCDVDARPVEFDIDFLINPPQTNGMKSINLSRGIDKKLSPTSFLQQTQRFSKHYLSNIEWILRDDSTELGSHISTACFSFAPTVPGDKAWRALSQDGIILPSDFMHVDRLAGVCLEGKLSHDTGRCLCTVSGRREGRTSSSTGSRETLGAQAKTAKRPRTRSISGSSRLPPSLSICPNNGSDGDFLWVLPGGMTSEAQYLVQKDAEFAQDDLEYDIFGNSTLHFLAARAQPMVFFKALAVFGAVTELNSGDQTFLHCLGPQWFNVDNLRPLGTLLTFLRYIDFDVNARDVYGQSIFHIIAQRTHEPHTIPEHIARQYGFREFSCRDAFGLQPSPTTNTLKHLLTPDLGDREDKPSSIHTGSSDWSDFSDVKIIKNEHHNPHQGTADIDAAHTQLLALIAEASTNPEIEDSEGRNALHCLAIVSPPIGSMSSADTLSAAETDNDYAKHVKGPRERIQRRNMDLIIEEEFKWRLTTLERLLSGGVDVNAYNASGNTVLMEFVLHLPDYHDHNGTGSILYQLINFGAKLNARNRQGDTALHLAVCRGHKVAMATLVLSGAQVHARNRCLQSPLELVAGLISETQDDIQTYSNFEACYAWLSSETAGARLWSSFKDEWGESEHWACGRALPIVKRPAAAALEDALVTLKRDQEMDMAEVRQKGMDGLPEWSQWVDSDKREALSDTSTSSLTKSLIKKELSESPSSTRPPWRDRDTLVDDMCDHILSNAFSVTTEEICNPGDIWQSVQTCLNEVLAILSSDDTTRWQDIHIDAISPPCDSPSSDTPRTNSRQEAVTMPSSNSLGKRKLPGGGNSDDELGERNSDGNKNPGLNPSGVGPPEQKRAKACIRFGCPYRKRNPLRFNVREHLNCATQSFTDMAQLK
ncbi:hypothetical protein BKA56DRAFT_277894 [Ilyonectria sp. MPI-CAGE-AT-0026]|nr:hypothetical protein BKA56DRAFT_277894 [Ilyonectria sp. MPI-CAGE-AT-0026]